MHKGTRWVGFLLFTIGIGLTSYFYDHEMTLAKAHSPQVSLNSTIIFFPAFSAMGLLLLIFGQKVRAYSEGLKSRKKTWKDFLLVALILSPGFLVYLVLKGQLEQLGFRF